MSKEGQPGESLSLERLFQAAPCYITAQNRALEIVAANDAFVATFGDASGASCFQAYGQSAPCAGCPVERTFLDGQGHHGKVVITLPDGREAQAIAFASPVLDGAGEVCAVVEVLADVSEHLVLERELRESREQFRQLFEEVPCYISVQDRDLRIVRANRMFRENFGDQTGAFCFDLYKHRDEECTRCPVAETFGDGLGHHSEEVVTALSGDRINTLVTTAPLVNALGEVEAVMEMSADITRVRQLQGQLTNIGTLISSISHDLKGLLTGMDGGSYMIRSGLDKEKRQRVDQGLDMVQRSLKQFRQVVMDLLYLSGEGQLELAIHELADVARQVAESMRKRAADLEIELQVLIDDQPGTCEVDIGTFVEALLGILRYAFEACRVDLAKPRHRVRFQLAWDEDNAVITIQDDGIGMDRETREKIFSLNFSSQGTGTSLGLFTANKVIERHRGIIELTSELNQGTVFKIRLPRAREGS